MSGTLFVIATPIGNLEDITLRALRVLREADLVAAEDTRRTAKLLSHHGISVPTLSFHEHNAHSRLPGLLSRLAAGARVALVSDAGTPGVSDPGVRLVRACHDQALSVSVIPGPSAPLAAAVASGFSLEPLTIQGFAPARAKDRRKWLETVRSIPHTVTWFEAPHRIVRMLEDASDILGERQMFVARELTKVHEELVRGTAVSIRARLRSLRGEFTIVAGPSQEPATERDMPNDQFVAEEFGRMGKTSSGGRRAAIATVAKRLGMRPRDVYAAIERARISAE
jgi:16S rRNA (cytidine1402-2'-O)-methyltransferase